MADFLSSTHRAKWIFSPQQLCGATVMEVGADGLLSYPEPRKTAKDSAEKHSWTKPLSIEEEQSIRVFYENKLQEVYNNFCAANNFHFPHKIQGQEAGEEIKAQVQNELK